MNIYAKTVIIGAPPETKPPKKRSLLSRALKNDEEDEDSPVIEKLSTIAEILKSNRAKGSQHVGGG